MDRRTEGARLLRVCAKYLVHTDNAIIVDVETTRAIRQAEVGAARTMIDRARDRFGLCPERLIAASVYGSAPTLGWLLEERGIEPHISVFDKSGRWITSPDRLANRLLQRNRPGADLAGAAQSRPADAVA